jgi:YggT family protein
VLLAPIVELLQIVLELYSWVVIISVIMSWLVQFGVVNTHNRAVYMIGSTINQLVDPPLRFIRRYLPTFGNLDLSPIVLLLAIFLAQRYLGIFARSLGG